MFRISGRLEKLASFSLCQRRGVGCILVDVNMRVLSTGYNKTPCCDASCPGVGHPSGTALDLCRAVHAEQLALVRCRNWKKLHAAFISITPCLVCARMLAAAGVKQVFARNLWSNSEGLEFLKSEGVEVFLFRGDI